MNSARLKALIDLVGSAGLSELKLTEGDVRVRIKASRGPARADAAAATEASPPGPDVTAGRGDADTRSIVRAPLAGTFFAAPSPEAPPFYGIGDRVTRDSMLCIIEAMKTMTHVASGYEGILRGVLVENGTAVEFGQPLFEVS